jgi:hypothetical protein
MCTLAPANAPVILPAEPVFKHDADFLPHDHFYT